MKRNTYDIIIMGGGVMGSATAYSLSKADKRLSVAVVEPDPTYTRASTALSLSNARIQFSLAENIQISQYALDVLDTFETDMTVGDRKPHIVYRREGNLFLINEAALPQAEKAFKLQKDLGCQVDWWSPEQIQNRYPLYDSRQMAAGTFGSQDGHFDAYAFLMGYKTNAIHFGTDYIKDEVVAVMTGHGQVEGVGLGSGEKLFSNIVVNCTGAWATQVAAMAHVTLPVQPVKRQVFVLDTKVKPEGPLPLTILPSGLYFRTETGGWIVLGKSMPDDPVGFDFSWDEKRFTETLWPELAEFVPLFDTLKLMRGWAGLYAVNTLDGNAILGEWPELEGFFLANGFSGHGLQQAPAVGRYLSELITGQQPTLNLSIFSPDRILENNPLSEAGLV
jgi:glycine/D-amino acid oxidase-like deaminating enzyme